MSELSVADWLPLLKIYSTCNPGSSVIQKIMVPFRAARSIGSDYPIGVALDFLPCGVTYPALLTAARGRRIVIPVDMIFRG